MGVHLWGDHEIYMGTWVLCFGGQESLAPFKTIVCAHIFKLLIMYCPLGIFVLLVATCFKSYRKYLSACLSRYLSHGKLHFLWPCCTKSTPFPGKSYDTLYSLNGWYFPPSLSLFDFPGWSYLHNLGQPITSVPWKLWFTLPHISPEIL